jgi:hypothetical protein
MRACFHVIAAALCAAGAVSAQSPPPATYIPQTKFARGQDVVPSFDGWIQNADGTVTLVFGYMNRNYEEELAIPASANNQLEPGPADQGQPTYFLPRRHAWVFRVKVPADFGNKELVWSITANGRTEKAYGHLFPSEEIVERVIQTRGNLSPGLDDPNKPPSISIAPVSGASVGTPVTLTATVTDDGLPKPRPVKERPAEPPAADAFKAQTNTTVARERLGLNVTWFEYRGPGKVTFDGGPIVVASGQAVTKAHFERPGTYVLRATANDGELSTSADVTVSVSTGH